MTANYSMKDILNKAHSGSKHALSNQELKDLQDTMLSIYRDVYQACDKHHLKIFLQGGTLLGKIRHNGFIPWDDDMDFGMSRHDYDQFIQIFDKELSDKYILRAPGYHDGTITRFVQVYKKDTYYEVEDGPKGLNKIKIDIFPIDYVPDNKIACFVKAIGSDIQAFTLSSLEFRDYCNDTIKEKLLESMSGKFNYYLRIIVAAVHNNSNRQKLYKKLDDFVAQEKESRYCTSSMGRKHYVGETQPASTFFPLKRTKFCGENAWIINHPKRYLRHNYGPDFMVVPPEDKRESHFVVKIRT